MSYLLPAARAWPGTWHGDILTVKHSRSLIDRHGGFSPLEPQTTIVAAVYRPPAPGLPYLSALFAPGREPEFAPFGTEEEATAHNARAMTTFRAISGQI
jgi:hypothetical protein